MGLVDNVSAIWKFNWFLTCGTLDNSLLHVRGTTCIYSCEHTPHARAPKLPTEFSMKQCRNVHAGTFAPLSNAALNVLATMIGTKWETCRQQEMPMLGEAPRVLRHIFANNPMKSPRHNFICQAAAWRRLASARLRQPTLTVTWSCTKRMGRSTV